MEFTFEKHFVLASFEIIMSYNYSGPHPLFLVIINPIQMLDDSFEIIEDTF